MIGFYYQIVPTALLAGAHGIAIGGAYITTQNVAIQGNVVTGIAIRGQQVYTKPG